MGVSSFAIYTRQSRPHSLRFPFPVSHALGKITGKRYRISLSTQTIADLSPRVVVSSFPRPSGKLSETSIKYTAIFSIEYRDHTHGKPGKDKTTGFKTHQILIMLLTDRAGHPCAWDVFDGSAKEVSKFEDLAERICEEHKITNVTYCFDRGFASTKNFKAIKGFLSRFISGIDKDQIEKVFDIERFQDTRNKILDHAKILSEITAPEKREAKRHIAPNDGFCTSDGERYYKELGVQGQYRHIAGFSTEIFQYNENFLFVTAQQKARCIMSEVLLGKF